MENRKCNISNYQEWKASFRRSFSNALFNQTYKTFDNVFRKIDLDSDPNLFTKNRIDKIITNKDFFTRFDVDTDNLIEAPNNLDDFLKRSSPTPSVGSMYFLFGKKGIGKSTLTKYYIQNFLEKQRTVPIYIDLHGLNCHINEIQLEIKKRIQNYLYNDEYSSKFFQNPSEAKKVRKEFEYFTDSDIAKAIFYDRQNGYTYLEQFLLFLAKDLKKQIYLFFDNTDELAVEFVSEIIRCSYDIRSSVSLRVIHCLRDYWGSPKLNFGKQYQVLSTYLTPPDLHDLIQKRINYLKIPKSGPSFDVEYYYWDDNGKRKSDSTTITYENINEFLKEFVSHLLREDELIKTLYEMSNYDIREVLDNIYNFFHSCNLPIISIFQKTLLKTSKGRPLNVNDLIRNMMTIHSLCYDFESSKIVNIFDFKNDCNSSSYRNTLGLVRILQRVSNSESSTIEEVVRDFITLGYRDKHLVNGINYLFKEGMLESPDGNDYENIINLSITGKGHFYISNMLFNFEYLSYVHDRVPMPKRYHTDINTRFGHKNELAGTGNFKHRSDAVLNFIDFLQSEEELEEKEYGTQDYQYVLNHVRAFNGKTFSTLKGITENTINEIRGNIDYSKTKQEIEIKGIKPVNIIDEDSVSHKHPYDN
jgi:GTPase SAR1 family protein